MMCKKEIRESIALCREQLKGESTSLRMWSGYLLGVCMASLKTLDYLHYCNGNPIQMAEPFIIIMNDYAYSVFIILGLFLVLVDSPFIDSRSIYVAIRGSRKSWCGGMMLYIALQIVLYYFVIFLTTVLLSFWTAYFQNTWSQSCYILGSFHPTDALEEWGLSFDGDKIIKYISPWKTFLITFFLNILYSLSLLLLIFVINMNGRRVSGNVAAILLHLSGIVFIKSFYLQSLTKYSLLARSQLTFYQMSERGIKKIEGSLLLFAIVLAAEVVAGIVCSHQTDFIIARGDREK